MRAIKATGRTHTTVEGKGEDLHFKRLTGPLSPPISK